MDMLRDPLWDGISAFLALLAIVLEMIIQRDRIRSYGLHLFTSIICAVAGIAIMSLGPLLSRMLYMSVMAGIPAMWDEMTSGLAQFGSLVVYHGIFFGLFPGTVTAMAALSGRDRKQRIKRAIVTAVVSLMIVDTVQFMQESSGAMSSYLYALFTNLLGGPIAGYLIAIVAEVVTGIFGDNTSL